MKIVYTVMLCVFAGGAWGQDFCKQVKKEVSEDKTQTDFSSPVTPKGLMPIIVKRSINTNPEFEYDNFTVEFRVLGELESIYSKGADGGITEKKEKKLVVEFDDKSKFVDDTVEIGHDITEDRVDVIRELFYPVTSASIGDFTTKKIAKFSLAGNERTIPADTANAIMHYFQCMKEKK